MFKRKLTMALSAAALAAAVTACGSSSGGSATGVSNAANTSSDPHLPTVSLMVGGIDKQIYLPYQLAQNLGFYKKYGVNVQLSTEQNGGVGAEEAMASGQVDMAGAWYVHTIDFQQKGKAIVDVVQLSGAPGEREMCATGSGVNSPAQWKGKTVGVTDIGSGTDNLTVYLAARNHLTTKDFSRAAVGASSTFVAALQNNRIVCGMTTPAHRRSGPDQGRRLLGHQPGQHRRRAAVAGRRLPGRRRARSGRAGSTRHRPPCRRSSTRSWRRCTGSTPTPPRRSPTRCQRSSSATDSPPRPTYTAELAADKGQFLPDGMMPASGPPTALAIDKFVGNVTGPVNIAATYTNQYAIAANKLEGYTK